MKKNYALMFASTFIFSFIFAASATFANDVDETPKKLAYIASDLNIPFWAIMSKGIGNKAESLGFEIEHYSANNSPKVELQNLIDAIEQKVDGIILSPISSSTSVTLLKLAKKADIPVVIAGIGTDGGDYVSYVSSDNATGAYKLGQILGQKMQEKGWQQGRVGIIAIPQKRENGKVRTQGFIKALGEYGIHKADLRQQVSFSYAETYEFSKQLIEQHSDLRAIWLQGSDRYQAALDAIKDTHKIGEIFLICFDAEPSFLELIPQKVLVGSAMQQPFLMGEQAVKDLEDYFQGRPVNKETQLPILAISENNIEQNLLIINRNVLGLVD
ncbi:substrate-binding domain-containing protein [Thiomicrorhabdus aquaedulcis]|uniref:substrate-binding domain-containing protein n=1 Tax=Thiomicrorhabdus aquaedulcis TaxID=2211106 RepID=UPI0018D4FEFF|nr:substrate-binding domain-containing protein [Thiomicrorhabdus aquaedulcis]